MTEPWTPLCLVAACDESRAVWPLPVVTVLDDLSLTRDGASFSTDAVPQLAFAISLSPQGAAVLDRLGLDLPRHDLTSPDAVPQAVAGALALALAQSQSRVARQLREIAQLRQMTERSLQDFQRLEAFVWQVGKGERSPTHHLAPQPGLTLDLDGAVEQRLPGSSVGLSDVAIWIDGGTGSVTVRLTLLESARTVGEWHVDAPGAGWLRLALPRALGGDAQTAILRLQGQNLTLGRAFDHPDARFQCQGGATLALRLWGFVPGTLAPLSPAAHAVTPGRGRWLVGPLALAELAPDKGITPMDGAGGLMLRPDPGQTLTLRLPDMGQPGMRHVLASVVVDGQADLALSLSDGAPVWQALSGPAQVHLPLPVLTRPQDLVLTLRGDAAVILDRIEAFAEPMGRDV